MAVPKKKTSKRRSGNRTSANTRLTPITLGKCSKCGKLKKPHVVCDYCGFYGGKKILDIKSALDKKTKKEEKSDKE